MSKLKYVFFIVFFFAFTCKGFSSSLPEKFTVKEYNFYKPFFYEEIPFELVDGQIILKVRINEIFYNFLFDTGAITIVSDELGSSFKRLTGTRRIFDTNGVIRNSSRIKLDKLSINNLSFKNITALALDLSIINKIGCVEISGVIGADIMKNKICQINYEKKVLICTNSIGSLNSKTLNHQPIDFSITNNGSPSISMFINGLKSKNILLDTGFTSGISIANAEAQGMSIKESLKSYGLAYGAFGSVLDTSYAFRCNINSFEKDSIDSAIISYRLKNEKSKIGYQFLKNYILTIDWKNKKIYLKKIKKANDSLQSFGFKIYYHDNKLLVNKIYENSPAYSNGIRLFDQILKMNNVDYTSATHEDYCNILKNEILEQDQIEVLMRNDAGDSLYVLQRENILK